MFLKILKLQTLLLVVFFACYLITNGAAEKNNGKSNAIERTNVGLVFEHTLKDLEKVFHLAVEKANENNEDLKLHGVTTSIEPGNAFDTSKKLCKMLKHNLVAVVGPTTTFAAKHAMSICDAKELPFIDTRWDFNAQLPTINLHPDPSQLAIALKDLVVGLEWTSFTIIYETGEFLATVKELLQMYGTSGPTVTVRRYELDLNGDYRNVLRRIKYSGETSFVVVGAVDTLPELFKQAQQVGLMTGDYRYIVGNLDFQTMDLEPFQHGDTNITSFRLISPENDNVFEVSKALYDAEDPYQNVSCPLTVNMALVYDGVQLLAETFQHVIFRAVPLNCNDDSTWDKGYTLVNYMKSFNIQGLSGEIKLDNQGLRTEFALEVVELTVSGLQKIGTWTTNDGFSINRPAPRIVVEQDQRSLVNKSFVVITAISEPYGMLKDTAEKLEGNDQYEGFGIELIEELSKKLGFSYTFRIQEDNKYGNLDQITKTWNGMILEIIEKRADMGITDLTMTSDRESGVDFTIPFMNLGIAILFRKPMKEPPQLFSFMSPFSGAVWMWLGIAYVSVSVSMFVLSRISPTEWDNPYPCIEEPTELENQFSFVNCFWFSIGALLQQGTELAPKGLSTRAVASAWWFFTLILVSSYTANLAAFLTIESLSSPINNVEDLAENKGGVKYGAKVGGSTYTFFQDAQYPTYQRMFAYMKEHPELMTSTNNEGVQRVENDNYAFLMESTTVEYNTERRCKVTQVGALLDEKGYGIAMRKNWPYRDLLSQAILELQEQGVLSKMKTKWWQEKRGGGACTQGKSSEGAKGLGFPNLGGVYLVLVVGSALASVYGILEWLWSVYSTARSNKVSFKAELMDEIRFILRCSVNEKPVKYPKNSSRSSSSSSKSKHRSTSSSVDSLPTEHLEEHKKHSVAEQGKLAKLK
ncbi:glutamate receptor ionotropic, kainate 2-like isoform X1 [Teleopsis dalmanni]|uniref:glutamate receptor ionotropic, kainate 2-like isoform X1 n=1 Tax=Teleopsis dalmanni TaxID=139649 RepID=UPI0018CF2DF0|nr:glutamate receptor ionotropic, kainate 2-like isoform X1 [Teleopsis dalmanni]XP_037950279.1 glutamate receptor ionotropic, kainate 2-like isoform X1 [Teleopsis dalmanni]